MAHTCTFGDSRCGRPSMFVSAYETLCPYCKRKYDLELAQAENARNGELARQRRESREAANEAIGEFVSEHPVATVLGLLGMGLGVVVAKDVQKSREHHENVKKKLKK